MLCVSYLLYPLHYISLQDNLAIQYLRRQKPLLKRDLTLELLLIFILYIYLKMQKFLRQSSVLMCYDAVDKSRIKSARSVKIPAATKCNDFTDIFRGHGLTCIVHGN